MTGASTQLSHLTIALRRTRPTVPLTHNVRLGIACVSLRSSTFKWHSAAWLLWDHKGGKVSVTIRPAVAADAETCGRIIYEAFKGIADRHGFPPHFSSVEAAIQRAKFCISHPAIFGVAAESDGQVIGSNFVYERDPIRGLGAVTVDPQVPVRGTGRPLME